MQFDKRGGVSGAVAATATLLTIGIACLGDAMKQEVEFLSTLRNADAALGLAPVTAPEPMLRSAIGEAIQQARSLRKNSRGCPGRIGGAKKASRQMLTEQIAVLCGARRVEHGQALRRAVRLSQRSVRQAGFTLRLLNT